MDYFTYALPVVTATLKISNVVCASQASNVIVSALNQNLVEFELKPGVRVIVYNTQLTLGKKHFFLFFLFLFLCCV